MSIRFACEHCGHSIEVDEHFAGKQGHCKHCGHATAVPTPVASEVSKPMRLRPIEEEAPGAHLEPAPAPRAHKSRPEKANTAPYEVLGADRSTGPARAPRIHSHSLIRFPLSTLRTLRNWLYVVSVLALAAAAIGFFLQNKRLLHAGSGVVIASNIAMLAVGLFYLVLIPFKEGLVCGLANVLCPPYTVYYWWTRWPKVKKAVLNTAGSFLPIALVGIAYFLYEEAPVIERELPVIEKTIENEVSAIEKKVESSASADDSSKDQSKEASK